VIFEKLILMKFGMLMHIGLQTFETIKNSKFNKSKMVDGCDDKKKYFYLCNQLTDFAIIMHLSPVYPINQ